KAGEIKPVLLRAQCKDGNVVERTFLAAYHPPYPAVYLPKQYPAALEAKQTLTGELVEPVKDLKYALQLQVRRPDGTTEAYEATVKDGPAPLRKTWSATVRLGWGVNWVEPKLDNYWRKPPALPPAR